MLLRYTIVIDVTDPVTFNMFEMNTSTGVLGEKLGVEFDREMRDFYNLTVMVMDSKEPVRIAIVQVHVRILALNDIAPTVILPPPSGQLAQHSVSFELPCIVETTALLYRVAASDPDLGDAGLVQFSLIEQHAEYPL